MSPKRDLVIRAWLCLPAEHASVSRALQLLEEFTKSEELLAGAFVQSYQVLLSFSLLSVLVLVLLLMLSLLPQLCKGLSTLVRRVGLETFEKGLAGLNGEALQRLRSKRKRYRVR